MKVNANFKKLCVILAVLIAISTISVCTISIADEPEKILIAREEALLKDLNILEENVDYSSPMTRAELVQFAARVCNVGTNVNVYSESPFYDVSVQDAYYADLCALIENGVIAGDGNGFFRPDDEVVYNEICKVFSVILGYKTKGEYTSFLDTARQSGILDGIEFDGTVTWGLAAKMAFNTLHNGMFEAKVFGDKTSFFVNEDYLALEFYHQLKVFDGIVSGMYGTTLSDPSNELLEDMVTINETNYTCPEGKEFFGKHTVYYVSSQDKNAIPEIKHIYESERNTVLSISSSDIEQKTGESILYYQGSKEKEVKFRLSGDVVINGVAHPSYADADFCPDSGNITLIDNDNDRVYDVALIDSYEYIVVGGVDYENHIIYDKNSPSKSYGTKDANLTDFRLYKDDMEAYVNALVPDTPVAIQKSWNTKGKVHINVYLPSVTVENTVEGVYTDGIVVAGTRYELEKNTYKDMAISVGDMVKVYLFDGRVGVVLHSKSDGYRYGYLLDAAKTGTAFTPGLKVLIVTQSKDKVEYNCTQKLYVDETLQKNADVVLGLLNNSAGRTFADVTLPRAQMIRYKLNDANEVTHIDTNTYDSTKETEDSLQLVSVESSGSIVYYSSTRSFYATDDDSDLKFSVPAASNVWTMYKDDRADLDWHGNAFGNTSKSVTVEFYNVDEYSKVAKLVVGYGGRGTSVSAGAEPQIVQNVEKILNEDGEVVRKVTFVGVSNTPREYILDNDITLDLNIGDVVRFNGDGRGQIAKELIENTFSPDTVPTGQRIIKDMGNVSVPESLASVRLAYGAIVSLKDSRLSHTTSIQDDLGGIAEYKDFSNFTVPTNVPCYLYDTNARNASVETISLDEIITYEENNSTTEKAIIYTTSGTLRFIYIIR